MQKRKGFEEYYAEALTSIPLYNSEWTDFNASDPGITMIENLTAFNVLQQSFLERAVQECRLDMLKLSGFGQGKPHAAKVYVRAKNVTEAFLLPSNQKFMVGGLTFENNRAVEITDARIEHVFHIENKRVVSHDRVLDEDLPASESVFGGKAEAGSMVYFILNAVPQPGMEMLVYFTVDDCYRRNALDLKQKNPFAQMKWQLYTTEGYTDLKVNDSTGCFLQDGVVRLQMCRQPACRYVHYGYDGYAVRAVLERADYDIIPRLKHVDGFVFEAWQKSSEALCYTFKADDNIVIYNDMAELGYVSVFVREQDSADDQGYRKYELVSVDNYDFDEGFDPGDGKRCCIFKHLAAGMFRMSFDMQNKCSPGDYSNAVKLVVYGDTAMRGYRLGTVYGYDNQELELPCSGVIDEYFSVIVERDTPDGTFYDFVKPGSRGEDDLFYHLSIEGDKMIIDDAGRYINAVIYIGTMACTQGGAGNIDAGKHMLPAGYTSQVEFLNVSKGCGGSDTDSVEQLEKLYRLAGSSSYTAVTADDYKRIIKNTPGLCIKKVNAFYNADTNEVTIAVLPESARALPRLSGEYKELLLNQVDRYRMLCTRVNITGPEYACVDAYVKLKAVRTAYAKEKAEKLLESLLDYINTDKNFGDRLEFENVYKRILRLEDVSGVDELQLSCNSAHVTYSGLDIIPDSNCLLYPGTITVRLEEEY